MSSAQAEPRSPDFSAIIVSYERHELLAGAIDSLLRQDVQRPAYEIIVVDNSPDQRRAAEFGAQYKDVAGVRYVLEPVAGANNARNKGVALARASIVGFIDDDAVTRPDWIRQISAPFRANSSVGCVGGRILPRWTVPRPAWLADELLGYLSVVDWGGPAHELKPGEWLAACNMAFDREALLTAGGFAPALGRRGPELTLLSHDEIEAYTNLQKLGKQVIYSPAAVVDHIVDPSRLTQEWMRRRIAWQVVSDFLAMPKETSVRAKAASRRLRARFRSPAVSATKKEFLQEQEALRELLLGMLSGEIGPSESAARPSVLAWIMRGWNDLFTSAPNTR